MPRLEREASLTKPSPRSSTPDFDIFATHHLVAARMPFAAIRMTAVCHMLFIDGPVHCDPHRCNTYVTRRSKVVVLERTSASSCPTAFGASLPDSSSTEPRARRGVNSDLCSLGGVGHSRRGPRPPPRNGSSAGGEVHRHSAAIRTSLSTTGCWGDCNLASQEKTALAAGRTMDCLVGSDGSGGAACPITRVHRKAPCQMSGALKAAWAPGKG
jgi:hypothetical protein